MRRSVRNISFFVLLTSLRTVRYLYQILYNGVKRYDRELDSLSKDTGKKVVPIARNEHGGIAYF